MCYRQAIPAAACKFLLLWGCFLLMIFTCDSIYLFWNAASDIAKILWFEDSSLRKGHGYLAFDTLNSWTASSIRERQYLLWCGVGGFCLQTCLDLTFLKNFCSFKMLQLVFCKHSTISLRKFVREMGGMNPSDSNSKNPLFIVIIYRQGAWIQAKL